MEFISDKELISRLSVENPWWGEDGYEKTSIPHLTKRVSFEAFAARAEALATAEILLLAGPLGAGKSVMMRQLIAQLIENGAMPGSVFYCPLAIPSIASVPFEKLFNLFMNRNANGPEREVYLFVDEVQYLRDWEKPLLALASDWPRAHFICAVSSGAPSLITGGVTSGGRITTFVLPPLTFPEFIRFSGVEKKLFGDVATNGAAANTSVTVSPSALEALNAEFIRYVNFGGFMEAEKVLHQDLANLSGISDTRELFRLLALLALNTARELTIDKFNGLKLLNN